MDELKHFLELNDSLGAQVYVDALPQNNAHTWYLKGRLKAHTGDMAGALSCYRRAVEIDPNSKEAITMIEICNSIYDFHDPNLHNP